MFLMQLLTYKTTGHIFTHMSKREAKKDHILEQGLSVMKAHGFNGTSVKDIVDAAGVPKGSFYNYFDSKEAFALEAIEHAALDSIEQATKALNSEGSASERLLGFFSDKANQNCEDQYRIGCFLGNMCQEMADNNEPIRLKIKYVLRQHCKLIQAVLDEAKDNGELSETTDTKALAEFIFNAWEGTLMRMKASKSREPIDAFEQLLPGIIK